MNASVFCRKRPVNSSTSTRMQLMLGIAIALAFHSTCCHAFHPLSPSSSQQHPRLEQCGTCSTQIPTRRNGFPSLLKSTLYNNQEISKLDPKGINVASLDAPLDSSKTSYLQQDSSITRSTLDSISSAAAAATDTVDTTTTISTTSPLASQEEYQRGLLTIGFCTLVFASLSPVSHAALAGETPCPVMLLNAVVSVVAWISVTFVLGPVLSNMIPPPSTLQQPVDEIDTTSSSILDLDVATRAGLELGLWKTVGTVANLYGLSMTTSDHGAFLIQLTTLIVPVVQGIMGVPIPQRIQWAVGLALGGVALFTQDAAGAVDMDSAQAATRLMGDLLCVVAAGFYATYDLRLFKWGKQVGARQLISSKIATQAALSVALLLALGRNEAIEFCNSFFAQYQGNLIFVLGGIVLWSGAMVNALVPFLQVGGQQAIGPTRAQTLYASQPLWAAIMGYFLLGETVGPVGYVGGGAFLTALFLAATAEAPDANCGVDNCEV